MKIGIKIVEVGKRFNIESLEFEVPLEFTGSMVIQEYIIRNDSSISKYGGSLVEEYNRQNLVLNVIGCDEIIYGNQYKFGSYKVKINWL